MSMLISVIIATKNEEKNIENCLCSIKEQTCQQDNVELVVVDNNSVDNTRTLANLYTEKVYNIADHLYLKSIKNFRGAQLNFGVNHAKGEILFFPDADMTFHKDLFREVLEKIEYVRALYVPEIVCGRGFFGKVRNFERSFYNTTCIDGVRFVSKSDFEKVGGYDEKNIMFGPDDWDFTKSLKKAGIIIGITDRPLYHHEEWLTWSQYINKKSRYVHTFDDYKKKWSPKDNDLKKQFGMYYRLFWVFLERGKWRRIILHPMLTVGMLLLRLAVGSVYLVNMRRI